MTDVRTKKSLLNAEFLHKLDHLSVAARRVRLGMTKGDRRSKRRGSSVEFADYRDYTQGDDLRHIDWNIYSRLGALYIKLFEEQEDLTVHLLIDASQSMTYGTPSKFDFACQIAAAVGYVALTSYDRVSISAFSEHGEQRLEPVRGKANLRKMFGFFDGLRTGGATNLEQAGKTYFTRNRTKGVAILLSDLFDHNGFEEALRRLAMYGSELYVVHILAREEIEPDVVGDLKLVDCETNTATEISVSPALLKRYLANLTGFCEAARRFCLARNMVYVFAPNDTPIERLTLEVLRKGGLFE